MPQLRIFGIPIPVVQAVSTEIIEKLAIVCECGTDNFTLECMQTTAVFNGAIVPSFPFVEVAWFDRGPLVRQQFADCLTNGFGKQAITELEIAFICYRPDSYYINGRACE